MLITVVTPTLNAMDYLAECIESVALNTSDDVAVDHVVVDAGSTDGTVEFAKERGVRVIQERDDGIFDAINIGSFKSDGELLGFLGADDVMLPGAMEAVANAYRSSGRRWVVGGIRWIDEKGRSLGGLAAPPTWLTPPMHASLGWNTIMHMSTYISRDFYRELSGFDISFRHSGDYELFARALTSAPYARIPFPISCFRRTGENHSVVNQSGIKVECNKVLERYGPSNHLERLFLKYAMKGFYNLTNPQWLLYKISQPIRMRLKLQDKAYF